MHVVSPREEALMRWLGDCHGRVLHIEPGIGILTSGLLADAPTLTLFEDAPMMLMREPAATLATFTFAPHAIAIGGLRRWVYLFNERNPRAQATLLTDRFLQLPRRTLRL